MKTRINVLCISILVALALSMSMTVRMTTNMAISGFELGMESARTGKEIKIPNYEMIMTIPTDLMEKTGTITNLKNGEEIPIKPVMSLVAVDKPTTNYMNSLMYIIVLAGMIYALIEFIKLIRNINKSIIFDWKNVKLLRKLGWTLIIVFVLYFIIIFSNNYSMSQNISLNGCEFSSSILFSDPMLILGCVSLLIAEIFAKGLKMQEEQDLTI